MPREIQLSKGYRAVVDNEDYEDLVRFKWHAVRNPLTDHVYARRCTTSRGCFEWMHRRILGVGSSWLVDHINNDGLDNRRCNLRVATVSQNARNTAKVPPGSSGFHGVYENQSGTWRARIRVNGVRLDLGTFPTAIDAAIAYDRAAERIGGGFAHLNFPNSIPPGFDPGGRIVATYCSRDHFGRFARRAIGLPDTQGTTVS